LDFVAKSFSTHALNTQHIINGLDPDPDKKRSKKMATIAPFRGITYNPHLGQDISKLVTPPYDVISETEQEGYYQTHPHNVIRLILGKRKQGDSDWENRYTRAADYFRRWENEGILIREDQPCIYLTSLTYDPGNGMSHRTRWGIVALAKIEDEGSGVILPHEKTFSAHKDDRLKLFRACNAQFSQIFGLYEDTENVIMDGCKAAAVAPPQLSFKFKDGTEHKMWTLTSPSLFRNIYEKMAEKPIFIADGHHRYETARNYRNIMRERYGRSGKKAYEFVMMYLTNMCDEGLTILPSHRLIKSAPAFDFKNFVNELKECFDIQEHPFSNDSIPHDAVSLRERLADDGNQNTTMAFFCHNTDRFFILSLREDAREKIGEGIHPSLRKLDVLVLSQLILKRALGFSKEDMDNSDLFHYQSNIEAAISEVSSGNFLMAFLLNPTRIEQVREIASKTLVMPRKSTYFYPKVMTGLVLNKIDPYEIIEVP
jgi:uncharacterized protein (DUF1015 family)